MADEKKNKNKVPSWAWGIVISMIALGAIMVAISFWWPERSSPAPKRVTTRGEIPLPLQKWQFCWEKKPGFRGDSSLRRFCLPAEIRTKNRNHIIIDYGHAQTNGVIEVTAGGKVYSGTWKDAGGCGKIHSLYFTSPRTATGWLDEEGQRSKKYSFVLERLK